MDQNKIVIECDITGKIIPKNINIDGSDDKFYRYKMRQMIIKFTGKNKMLRTFFINIDDISDDLIVNPIIIMAYLSNSLNCAFKYDHKKNKCEKAFLNKKCEKSELDLAFDRFIKEYILCRKCGLPEISIKINKNIILNCRGCGEKNKPVKNSDKFEKYLINNFGNLKNVKNFVRNNKDEDIVKMIRKVQKWEFINDENLALFLFEIFYGEETGVPSFKKHANIFKILLDNNTKIKGLCKCFKILCNENDELEKVNIFRKEIEACMGNILDDI